MPRTEEGETTLEVAERHVREIQSHLADQERRVVALESQGRLQEAATARDLLRTMQTTLEVAQDHLAFERRKWGADPQI